MRRLLQNRFLCQGPHKSLCFIIQSSHGYFFFSELEDINTYVIAEDIVIAIISSTGFYFGVEFYQIDLCCKINTRWPMSHITNKYN